MLGASRSESFLERHIPDEFPRFPGDPLRLGFQAGDLLRQFLPLRGNDLGYHRVVILRRLEDLVVGAGAEVVQRFYHLQNPRLKVFVERA